MLCKHCGDQFDHRSRDKVKAGGFVNECPDCVEDLETESAVRYLGVAAGSGKMSDITILAFDDPQKREDYHRAWRNNSGFNKGKSCQLRLTSINRQQ